MCWLQLPFADDSLSFSSTLATKAQEFFTMRSGNTHFPTGLVVVTRLQTSLTFLHLTPLYIITQSCHMVSIHMSAKAQLPLPLLSKTSLSFQKCKRIFPGLYQLRRAPFILDDLERLPPMGQDVSEHDLCFFGDLPGSLLGLWVSSLCGSSSVDA